MSRKAIELKRNENDIKQLNYIIQNSLSATGTVKRARAILLCMEGWENQDIAKELDVRNNTVGDWRRAYAENGLESLKGKKRPGRRGKNGPDKRETVKKIYQSRQDKKWNVEELSKAAGTSIDTARRALREEGISLTRKTTWDIPVESPAAPRTVCLAGVYVSPDSRAIVFGSTGQHLKENTSGNLHSRSSDTAKALSGSAKDGLIPLTKALDLLSNREIKNAFHGRKMAMQEYLGRLSKAYEEETGIHLHAIVLLPEEMELPSMSARNMSVTLTRESGLWEDFVSTSLNPLCGTDTKGIMVSLQTFSEKALQGQEPFIWDIGMIPDDENGSPARCTDVPGDPRDAFKNPEVRNVMRISASVTDRDGNGITREIELVNGLPDISGIDYSTPLALAASIGEVEAGVSKGVNQMAKMLCEGYMDEAYKKNANDGNRANKGG